MRRFWHLSIISTFGSFQAIYIANVYKVMADDILDDHTLTLAATIGSVMHLLSRFIWSALHDRFGFRSIYGIITAIQLISGLLIWMSRYSETLYITCVAAQFLCVGCYFSLFPTACSHIFGIVDGSLIFTIIGTFANPGAAIASFLLVQLNVSTQLVVYIGSFLVFINCILVYYFDDSKINHVQGQDDHTTK